MLATKAKLWAPEHVPESLRVVQLCSQQGQPRSHTHQLSGCEKQACAAVDVTFHKEGFIHFLKYLLSQTWC